MSLKRVSPLCYCTTQQEAKLMEPEKFSEWRWVQITEYVTGDPWNQMNPALIIC